MYDYKCLDCGNTEEHIRKMDERESPLVCQGCQGVMQVQLSAPRIDLEGITGDFPGAADKWVRVRQQKMKQEAKRES